MCIDVARQISAGVDGLEIGDSAIYGPGRGLGLVLVPCRHERAFLERLQRIETDAERELHRHAFRIQALIGLLDQDVPVVVDLIEAGEPKSLVGRRILRALDDVVVVERVEVRRIRGAVGDRAIIDVGVAGELSRDIIYVAAPAVVVEHAAHRKLVRDQRQVHHRVHGRVRIAMCGGAVTRLRVALGHVEPRLLRDVAKRTRLGAAAEQGSLRAFENLDALHVDHVDVEIARREGQRLLIEVGRDVRERVDRGR